MSATTAFVLSFDGPLTAVLHPGTAAASLLARSPTARPRIVLDMGAVTTLDCSGIGLLAALYTAVRERGGDMSLLALQHRPRYLLDRCGLMRVFPAFREEETVLESFLGRGGLELYLERSTLPARECRRLIDEPSGSGSHRATWPPAPRFQGSEKIVPTL